MRKTIFIIAFVAWLPVAPSEADPVKSMQTVVQTFVIPRFRAVHDEAVAQQHAWTTFCARRTPQGITALREAYDRVSDAWARIEFVRIGPAAADLRVERLNYWLDRHNETGRTLEALLASKDPKSLAPATIAAGSVAGQGLPMIERLISGSDAQQLVGWRAAAKRRCAVARAMARSVSRIAGAIVIDWTKSNGAAAALAANKPWGSAFANTHEAASVFMTDLMNGLDVIRDSKLAMMLHDLANPGASRLAENARSGRSLRDIELNLASIKEAMAVFMAGAPAEPKRRLDAVMEFASERLDAVSAAEKQGDRKKRMAAVRDAIAEFDSLTQVEKALIPAATKISLGFNNLDGD